jgi:hypothetical protein
VVPTHFAAAHGPNRASGEPERGESQHHGLWTWTYASTMTCGVCAAPDAPIAAPLGERAIADLRVGDLVYSFVNGAVRAVPIVQATRTPVPWRAAPGLARAQPRRLARRACSERP